MRILPSILRMLAAAVCLAVLTTACAASPTVTVTREPSAAELAAQAEADRTFAATPAYLARVKERSSEVDTVRFEVFTHMESPIFDMGSRTSPVITGEQSGERSRIAMDMGELLGPAAAVGGFDVNAMTMTTIIDGRVTYLNAPFFAEMMSVGGISSSDYPWVQDLTIGWGRIDASSNGSSLLSDMGMNAGAGSSEMLELLDRVGNVLDGGADEVRGVPVQVAFAEVSVVDVLEQSGQSMSEMGIRGREAEALEQLSANIAVYIDDEGMVRRLEYNMNLAGITAVDPQAAELDLTMWQRVDFFDHGAQVDIVIPVSWVDITDGFEDLVDEFG